MLEIRCGLPACSRRPGRASLRASGGPSEQSSDVDPQIRTRVETEGQHRKGKNTSGGEGGCVSCSFPQLCVLCPHWARMQNLSLGKS